MQWTFQGFLKEQFTQPKNKNYFLLFKHNKTAKNKKKT